MLLFFTLFLLYGLATVKDYGVSTDEVIERDSSLAAYKYIMPSVEHVEIGRASCRERVLRLV